MDKQPKPLSTKKPPTPSSNHAVIEEWMLNSTMPGIQPLIKKIDVIIRDSISDLQYAVKWSKAYYGTDELGWIIEVAAYHVSANIVFLKGAEFKHQPPLGSGGESRYIKLNSIEELNDPKVADYIRQAKENSGWK